MRSGLGRCRPVRFPCSGPSQPENFKVVMCASNKGNCVLTGSSESSSCSTPDNRFRGRFIRIACSLDSLTKKRFPNEKKTLAKSSESFKRSSTAQHVGKNRARPFLPSTANKSKTTLAYFSFGSDARSSIQSLILPCSNWQPAVFSKGPSHKSTVVKGKRSHPTPATQY